MTDEEDETSAKKRPPLHDLRGVRYVGDSDVRQISRTAFAEIGIDVDDDLVWDAGNEHFVAVSRLNAAAVDFLQTQEDFELA